MSTILLDFLLIKPNYSKKKNILATESIPTKEKGIFETALSSKLMEIRE